MTNTQTSLEAYSYRVSARFGSRVQVTVTDGMVSVTGPRLGLGLYRLWVGVQAVLLTLTILLVVMAAILWDWRYLAGAVVLLLAHLAAGGLGAGCLWELASLTAFIQGTKGETATFPLASVKRVKIGRGWARKGMGLLIFPYVGGINSMAEGFCVSFEAPDEAAGHDVVYGLHMATTEEAQTLARLLQGEQRSSANS